MYLQNFLKKVVHKQILFYEEKKKQKKRKSKTMLCERD